MQIIKPSCSLIEETNPLMKIERCGRVCYKSEDKITEDSNKAFVQRIIENKHTAMLEHAVYSLVLPVRVGQAINCEGHGTFLAMDYVMLSSHPERQEVFQVMAGEVTLVTGNVRAWRNYIQSRIAEENGWMRCSGILQALYRYDPDQYNVLFADLANPYTFNTSNYEDAHVIEQEILLCCDWLGDKIIKRHVYMTADFICDRGVSHELVRHRPVSFAQESTRYCNYRKAKFGSQLTFIDPCFWMPCDARAGANSVDYANTQKFQMWRTHMEMAESGYNFLIGLGATPQEARAILPNSLKTEIIMTAPLSEWDIIFGLRDADPAHPQMREVMSICHKLAQERYSKYDINI